jgi:hypothetical protein
VAEYQILSLLFNDRFVEVQYVDEDLNTEDVAEVRTKLLNPAAFKQEVGTIVNLLSDLIDKADVHRRNPPQSYSRISTPPLTSETE